MMRQNTERSYDDLGCINLRILDTEKQKNVVAVAKDINGLRYVKKKDR